MTISYRSRNSYLLPLLPPRLTLLISPFLWEESMQLPKNNHQRSSADCGNMARFARERMEPFAFWLYISIKQAAWKLIVTKITDIKGNQKAWIDGPFLCFLSYGSQVFFCPLLSPFFMRAKRRKNRMDIAMFVYNPYHILKLMIAKWKILLPFWCNKRTFSQSGQSTLVIRCGNSLRMSDLIALWI